MLAFITEANDLLAQMQDVDQEELLILDLSNSENYERFHLENAIHIAPHELMSGIKPAVGKLPDIERLNALFTKIGYTKEKHIIAYDDEGGGWAGRLLWTLDVIGHQKMSYLNGGIHAWLALGLPTTTEVREPEPIPCDLTTRDDFTVSKAEILNSLNDADFVVWDARSPEEHAGTRVFSARGGHIPGAINFEWTQAMDPNKQLRVRTDIKEVLDSLGISKDKKIITHCQTHHRSGLTYMIGKSLGYNIRAYDGSWSEWGNDPNTPIETDS